MNKKNWIPCHMHTSLSNNILTDSPSNLTDYISFAKDNGIRGLVVTEHGAALGWYNKKKELEKNGMKYVHAVEGYVTNSREENNSFHICIYGLNNNGRLEINQLISNAYKRDRSFYRRPRMMVDDVLKCKDIAISTACMAGVFKDLESDVAKKVIEWGRLNKDRLFVEIQPHNHIEQIEHNTKSIEIAKAEGFNLIASNDIHYTNKFMGEVRSKMQTSKGMNFSDEDSFDLSFKTYSEMLVGYLNIGVSSDDAETALENTNVLYDMVEEYKLDKSFKFPKLYNDSIEELATRCIESFKNKGYYGNKEYADRLIGELEVLRHLKSEDYMLLLSDWQRDNKKNSLLSAPSRGSASGSLVAYLLDITEIDSVKWGMNFSRFMNKTRISMPDIDLDYSPNDREAVKEWFYKHDTLHASDIVTFGTEQEKGAIDMMGRALSIPLSEVATIKDNITKSRESDRYKELFEYADATIGCVTKIGRHAGGVLVSDLNIEEELGLITITDKSVPTGHRIVSQLNMKELEDYGYIKVDVLGLSTQGALNRVEEYLGESKLDPNKSDLNDQNVYDAFHESPCCVFQFEGEQAWKFLSKALRENKGKMENFEIFSLTSGMLRPCADSVREDFFSGKKFDSGIEEINEYFKETNSYFIFQEQIMDYLVQFCGFDGVESDNVRRIISKGVYNADMQAKFDHAMSDIKSRFITRMRNKGHDDKQINIALDKFVQVVTDSQNYAFSKNHSHPYTFISYKSLYYRTYHKKEFITACLNEFKSDKAKMKEILNYVKLHSDIEIMPPVFGKATMEYMYDKEESIIYEGLFGAKGLSKTAEGELNKLNDVKFATLLDMITYIRDNKIKLSPSDMGILVNLDFFNTFGGQKYLSEIVEAAMGTESKIKYDAAKVISMEKNIVKINEHLPSINNHYDNILDFIVHLVDNKIKLGQKEIKLMLDMGIITCDFDSIDDLLKIAIDSKSKVKYSYVKTEKTRIAKLENLKMVLAGAYPDMESYPVSKAVSGGIDAKEYVMKPLTAYVSTLTNEDKTDIEKAVNELRIVGHTNKIFGGMEKELLYILDAKNPYSDYIIRAFSLKTGEVTTFKCKKDDMAAEKDQLIVANETYRKEGNTRVEINGAMKWQKNGIWHNFIKSMSLVRV